MFTFFHWICTPFQLTDSVIQGHTNISAKNKKKTVVSQTGKSGCKDVTVCSLGHLTDSVMQGHTNILNERK
jgi:hypothetical protein